MNGPSASGAALHIGQHVRHRDFKGRRVTGTIRTLTIEDQALMATIALDRPIVIPPGDGFGQVDIHVQHVPVHELAPFDDRDEQIAALLDALQAEDEWRRRDADGALDPEWDYEVMVGNKRRAAIAKATEGTA